MNIFKKMHPSSFEQLIRGLKFYALVAFILPFPVVYWTDNPWIDIFAVFYFPIAADKLEQTKSGSVAAWLFGITMGYLIASLWTLITLISHMLGNDESIYGSMPLYWATLFCIFYFSIAWYGFGLVKGLNKLLRSATINIDDFDVEIPDRESEKTAGKKASRPSP